MQGSARSQLQTQRKKKQPQDVHMLYVSPLSSLLRVLPLLVCRRLTLIERRKAEYRKEGEKEKGR